MTNLQLPKIIIDRLLQLEVGEECAIIVPMDNKHTCDNFDISEDDENSTITCGNAILGGSKIK